MVFISIMPLKNSLPDNILNKVDFPTPLTPINPKIAPLYILKFKFSNTLFPQKYFLFMFLTNNIGYPSFYVTFIKFPIV